MSSIPGEIYFEIFLRVPVKSLLTCKCVCKTWFSLISSRDFVKMHFSLTVIRNNPNLIIHGSSKNRKRSRNRNIFYSIGQDLLLSLLSMDKLLLDYVVKLDYPVKYLGYSVKLMGCCDGLVCLWFDKMQLFCLWNPATREYKILPKSNIDYVKMVAFSYDSKSDDYKVLVGGFGSEFEVYSLELNSWKNIENIPNYDFYSCNKKKSGVLVNGNLHWLAQRKTDYSHVIVSLDISNEIFKEMELPKETLEILGLGLWVLEGCLCLIRYVWNGDFSRGCGSRIAEIWVMQNYGVQESWTRRYTVKDTRLAYGECRLMWSFKSGEILFGGHFDLVLYDTVTEYGSRVGGPDISSLTELYQEEVYFESLVSLKSGTYVGGEEQQKEKKLISLLDLNDILPDISNLFHQTD